MAAGAKGLAAVLAMAALLASPLAAGQQASPGIRASRIVSMVPALTETLFAIGAGPQVVGVSSYDVFPPEVARLPKVGALIDPDTERVLALRPDLVILYGSQVELQAQFARAGIRSYSYRHGGVAGVFESMRELGALTGHASRAAGVVRDLQARLDGIRARVSGRGRPRTMLVFERQPGTLRELYASGGLGFLHDMLTAAGGANVFADVRQESVQPSHETLLTRAPEVILEVRARGLLARPDPVEARAAWAALSSLPAVKTGRIVLLAGDHLVVPGPRLADGTEALARALHPDAFR